MAGLPKSYIKKYGVSKRAWQEYRKSKSKSAVTTRRRSKMAKKKKGFSRRRSSMGKSTKLMLAGFGYGLVREPINSVAKMVPIVGSFGDEAGLLALSLVGAHYGKGLVKQIGQAGIVIEAQNLSRTIMGGALNLFSTQKATATTQTLSFR